VARLSIEFLATELHAKEDFKYFNFRELGAVYVGYTHTFSTEILEDKLPDEVAEKRPRRRKQNIDEQEELKKLLLKYFEESQITCNESVFRGMHIRATRSEMMHALQTEREIALQKQIKDALEEPEKARLRKFWRGYRDKIRALIKLKEELQSEIKDEYDEKTNAVATLEGLITEYKEKRTKAGYTLVNKIVPGHYTEMVRWESHHPWSYHELDESIVNTLEKRNRIEAGFQDIRAEAEKILDKNVKRTITDMNKFFERNYGTQQFENIHKRAFAKKLGPDLIAKRVELQRRVLSLEKELGDEGRVEQHGDEIRIILNSDENINFKRYLDSQELMKMDWCFIDIEKPRFNTPQEEVSWVAINYSKNGELLREIHASKKVGEEFKSQFFEEKGCEIFDHYSNENDLMAGVQASINASNPDVLCAYNTPYDLIELRDTEHGLEVGPRKSRPKKEVTTRFFERIDVKGKIVIDPLTWAKIAKKFLPNKKLLMVSQELGLDFGKSINYKMMAELENIIDGKPWQETTPKTQAKIREFAGAIDEVPNLNEVCAQIIAHYVGDDVNILPALITHPEFQRYLRHLDKITEFADVNIQKAAHTPSAINNLQKKDFFERTGMHLDVIHRITDVARRAEDRVKRFVKKKKRKGVRQKTKEKGLKKNIAHFVMPTWPFLRKDMEFKFPKAKELFDYVEEHRDVPEDYYTLSQYADSFCKYLMQAWGKYIKARDEFDKSIDDSGLDYYKIDQACGICKSLLQDTHDKDRIKKMYVPVKTLETLLNSRAYMKEYRAQILQTANVSAEVAAENEKQVKGAIRQEIKKLNKILRNQNLEASEFQDWLNEWLRVEKKRGQVIMPFNADPEGIEILAFESKLIRLTSALKTAGVKVVHKKNEHLFTTVEGVDNLPEDLPLMRVDEHEKVYIAKDPSSGNKIYYPKRDFYGGIKLQDEPSNVLTLFEMDAYGGFLEQLFDGRIDAAVRHLERCLQRFRDSEVPNEELVFFVKSSQTYKAFVGDEEIKFYLSDERKTTYDKKKGMYFVWEMNKKGAFEKIYVSTIADLNLDREKYSERIEDRIEKLLAPMREMTAEEEYLPAILQERYPRIPGGFEKYSDLKQTPIETAKKAIEQGQVLEGRGLAIFKTYKAYRRGFRADFEHQDIQQAKALWAWNMIQENLIHPATARCQQFIVPSKSREDEFHIVTKDYRSSDVSPYSCTCEWAQFSRKKHCEHIRNIMQR